MGDRSKIRNDEPGAWHHVTNRGVAKRSMFESRAEVRKFQALLAQAVRRGYVEVIAFAVMGSHFHLVVRSPGGELSKGMQWVESQYCSWFNSKRERQGHLVASRFVSKRVRDGRYRYTVLGYVDWNPVDAGLADCPDHYPYGSAWHYARKRRPKWLATQWIDEILRCGGGDADRDSYARFSRPSTRQVWVIEARLRSRDIRDPDRVLTNGPIEGAAEWFRRRAEMADGVESTLPVASPCACREAVERSADEIQSLEGGSGKCGLQLQMCLGLIRDLCRINVKEAAARCEVSRSTAHLRLARHREMLAEGGNYPLVCAKVARLAIGLCLE